MNQVDRVGRVTILILCPLGNVAIHIFTMTLMLSQTMYGGKYENISSIKTMGSILGSGDKKIAID